MPVLYYLLSRDLSRTYVLRRLSPAQRCPVSFWKDDERLKRFASEKKAANTRGTDVKLVAYSLKFLKRRKFNTNLLQFLDLCEEVKISTELIYRFHQILLRYSC